MPLRETLSNTWDHVQGFLFPMLREEAGPLTAQHERLVVVLEVAGVEAFVRTWPGLPGRPLKDRHALARSFVAKAVLGLATTAALIERLAIDRTLRRLCGWERAASVPGESTFSRAFAEFARSGLPGRAHEALIKQTHKDRLVGHISRDATAIEAREKPARTAPAEKAPKRKRGRPKKGEAAPAKEPRRLERQVNMTLAAMLADLPTACAVGTKRNAKGHTTSWIGYKLHIDTADGDIPVSCLLTSASVHDSQVGASAGDDHGGARHQSLRSHGQRVRRARDHAKEPRARPVPIIDPNPRRGGKAEAQAEARARRCAGHTLAEDSRFKERSPAECVNSALKESHGARFVSVRGHDKVLYHLMFGILALADEQLMRLVT